MLKLGSIPNFETSKVLVYGDLMLDRYWYGNTSRISPEAPVPVVHVQQCRNRPGGAANVALNIAALGGKTTLFGIIGNDAEAHLLRESLECKQVACRFLAVDDFRTVTKLRVIGQQQQLIRMDFEQHDCLIDDANLIADYQQHLAETHVVVLSDYAKGALLKRATQLIALARQYHKPILVDPKSADFACYQGASLLTPNLKEFEAVVGICTDVADMEIKARQLLNRFDLGALLITRGKDGMTLVPKQGAVLHIPAHTHEVYDVTGAGDTVIAVIAAALAVNESLEQAVYLANLAAGIVVTKLGAETVSVAELRRATQPKGFDADGVVSEEELLILAADARAHGEAVVMTNGCFDILHAGHIQYLSQAKALGKRLIVAVNDDASVAKLKGSNRPLNRVADRMAVLAALRVVDWVVPFSEDTPQRLIEAVAPDILVKGGDYQPQQIAGNESVLARGGQVLSLSFKPGYSTTALLTKITEGLT